MLSAAKPSPFSHTTEFAYTLFEPSQVNLSVFDLSGRTIRVLESAKVGALDVGLHSVRWNGRDDRGRLVPDGIYFCRLKVAAHSSTTKVVLTR